MLFTRAELGAFHLPPGLQGYPIMLASATSPGKLPPLHKEHKEGGAYAGAGGVDLDPLFEHAKGVAQPGGLNYLHP
ncbi:hypothetical protein HAALTHF_17160n [Vreelandella aquamarina]|nr:hypothetical protein HAALTHF_17160n [Halomonas axialensis]